MTADHFVSRSFTYPNKPLLCKCGRTNSSQFLSKITFLGILSSPGAISTNSLVNAAGNMEFSDANWKLVVYIMRYPAQKCEWECKWKWEWEWEWKMRMKMSFTQVVYIRPRAQKR